MEGQVRSLAVIPDEMLLGMDSDTVIPELYEKLPLTDRQFKKLTAEGTGREKTKLLVNMLKEHHNTERAYNLLLEALRIKNSDLHQKISTFKHFINGMSSVCKLHNQCECFSVKKTYNYLDKIG